MAVEASSTVETLWKVSAGGALGYGVAALLAPRPLMKAYGMQPPVGEALYLARMWGTRNVAIGALTLTAKGRDARRSAFMLGAAMNAVDAALALATPGLSSKTRTQGALTSGAFGAMALYALRES